MALHYDEEPPESPDDDQELAPSPLEGLLKDWPELTWEDFERGSELARSQVRQA